MKKDRSANKRKDRRVFGEEFKAEAVNLVNEPGQSIPKVAKNLDISQSALRSWVQRAHTEDGKVNPNHLNSTEKQELLELRKEIRQLRMEREILRKAAACVL